MEGEGRGGEGRGRRGEELKCYRHTAIRHTDIQTYRPSDEAGPRGAFAPNKARQGQTTYDVRACKKLL